MNAYECMNEWMNEWMNERTNERMNEWIKPNFTKVYKSKDPWGFVASKKEIIKVFIPLWNAMFCWYAFAILSMGKAVCPHALGSWPISSKWHVVCVAAVPPFTFQKLSLEDLLTSCILWKAHPFVGSRSCNLLCPQSVFSSSQIFQTTRQWVEGGFHFYQWSSHP